MRHKDHATCVADLEAKLEKAEAESDEWRAKALDVEKHPVVLALLAERDDARAAIQQDDVEYRALVAKLARASGCRCPHCHCICVDCEKCGDEVAP